MPSSPRFRKRGSGDTASIPDRPSQPLLVGAGYRTPSSAVHHGWTAHMRHHSRYRLLQDLQRALRRNHGDHVLYSVAHTISDNLRPAEIIARCGTATSSRPPAHGGNRNGAADRRTAPRRGDERGACHAGRSTIPHPTISIGVAALQPGRTGKQLLAEAGRALSRAKNSGGNCISGVRNSETHYEIPSPTWIRELER